MADLSELIEAYRAAKVIFDAAHEDDDEPERNVYEAAEHEVIIFPCRTLEDVQVKARFFLENEGPYDTLRNCLTATE